MFCQTFTATWACSANGNPAVSSGITGTAVSVTGASSLGIQTCSSTAWCGGASVTGFAANNWPNALAVTDYFEISITPISGNTITVTDFSMDANDGFSTCCPHQNDFRASYSTDGFATKTNLFGSKSTNGNRTWATQSKAGLSVSVPFGTTFGVRIYFDQNSGGDPSIRNYIRNVSLSGSQTLPIELLSLSGSHCLDENCVNIVWQTASEQNNDYFSIERSTDGKEWNDIGKVNGAGNSSTTLNYAFTDDQLEIFQLSNFPTLYYRLKQTDFNGQYKYYGPISVHLAPPDEWNLILKNPADENLQGALFATEDADVTLSIIDLQGRIVYKEKLNTFKGSNFLQINTDALNSGLYFIKASCSDKNIVRKFVKL